MGEVAEVKRQEVVERIDDQPSRYSPEEQVVMELLRRDDLPLERADAFLVKLSEIRQRNEAAEYNEAMRQVKANLPIVGRTAYNEHTKKKYADLADIGEACDKVIAEFGFSTEFYPFDSEKDGHLGMACTVSHAGGCQRTYKADVPMDGTGARGGSNMSATHAWKSTMTYARRALKEAIFDIAVRDDDGNGASNDTINDSQAKVLTALAEDHGADLGKVLKSVGASSVDNLTQKQWENAKTKLENWIDAKKREAEKANA